MSKAVYSALFDWLMRTVNTALAGGNAASANRNMVGVLDIFGFESFETNSFEQVRVPFPFLIWLTFWRHVMARTSVC